VRQRIARTSGAPGKTRLANVYRVSKGGGGPFYLVDLPGYGYARGDAGELAAVTRAYFGQERQDRRERQETIPARPAPPAPSATVSALLLIDARHPGLQSDLEAWHWLRTRVERCAVVATKIDKLSRAERLRALNVNEAAFEHPVQPVSARTGEGLDELWILIDRLLNNPKPRPSRQPLPHRKN
jgi:GTP-binding protein